MDLRVVLDITQGPGQWMASWFAKRPDAPDYSEVRPPARMLNEEIRSLGLVVGKPGLSGRIASFSLRANHTTGKPQGHPWLAKTPATLSRRAGAVSFWLKPRSHRATDQIIWCAGRSTKEDAMHLRISPDGKWHHIAAGWGPDAVELFLDGTRVAQDAEFQPLADDILRDYYFGSGPQGTQQAPLTADVDEIAVWRRPLCKSEIRQQRQASNRLSSDR